MPSTISAGTTAGTAIAVAGDTTGNLAFQTNGTTTAMTIDTSQNVGIGTTSPSTKLQVNAAYSADTTPQISFIESGGGIGNGMFFGTTSSGTRWIMSKDGSTSTAYPLAFYTGTTERGRFDTSGNFLFNSGYGSVATAYGCRAWVNFNGTGTVAIRGSGNVTSITDNGTGDFTVNFTTAMPDVNYSVQAMGGRLPNGGGTGERQSWCYVDNYTTSSIRVLNTQPSTTLYDQPSMFVSVFR